MDLEKLKYEKLRLHFIYLVSFLAFLIIVVASGLWTDKENFTEFLTNSATMISIVLGLVAIFYSFYSNSSLSQSLGNISKVSDEIIQTKTQLGEFLKESVNLTNAGNTNAELLKAVSVSVEDNVKSLNEALVSVTAQTKTLQESVSLIPARLDTLESKVIEATNEGFSKVKSASGSSAEIKLSDELITNFLSVSSLSGLLLLYAADLAFKAKKELSLAEFVTLTGASTVPYLYGYLIATTATGLLEHGAVKDESKTSNITKFNSTASKLIKEKVIGRIKSDYKAKPESLERWLKSVSDLEKHFAS